MSDNFIKLGNSNLMQQMVFPSLKKIGITKLQISTHKSYIALMLHRCGKVLGPILPIFLCITISSGIRVEKALS